MKNVSELCGLAYGCPALSRKKDCPFNEAETLSFQDKVKWIKGLSKQMKKEILDHHKACTLHRYFL
jgi:hypothetical protein